MNTPDGGGGGGVGLQGPKWIHSNEHSQMDPAKPVNVNSGLTMFITVATCVFEQKCFTTGTCDKASIGSERRRIVSIRWRYRFDQKL